MESIKKRINADATTIYCYLRCARVQSGKTTLPGSKRIGGYDENNSDLRPVNVAGMGRIARRPLLLVECLMRR